MSFFHKALQRINPFSGRKSSIQGAFQVGVSGPLRGPSTGIVPQIDAFDRNEIVFAAVDIRATAAGDPRLIVQERNAAGEWEESVGHPFRQLLMFPNAEMDEAALMKAAVSSMDVAGCLYCEMVRSGGGAPVELHPLDPSKIDPIYRDNADGSRTLLHYKWKDGRYEKEIPPEDMLVRKDWTLGKASAPLARAMGSVEMDNMQTDYVRAFFENAGVPSGVLKIRGRELTQEQSDDIRQKWRAKYNPRWGRQHDVAVLDENADYDKVGAMLNELESEFLRSLAESRISQVFKVPPILIWTYFGLSRSTYSNVEGARRFFWDTTMSNLLKEWRAWFQRQLLTEFVSDEMIKMERVRLAWDMTNVSALQEDLDQRHERARKDFEAGMTTTDEARADTGRDPWPVAGEGDVNPHRELLMARAEAAVGPSQQRGRIRGVRLHDTSKRGRGISLVDPDPDPDPKLRPAEGVPSPADWASWHARYHLAESEMIRLIRKQDEDREHEDEYLADYGNEIVDLAEEARAGEIDKDEFIERLQETAAAGLLIMFLVGALFPDELTEAEQAAVDEQVTLAQDAAPGFADDIYDGRYGGVHADEDDEPASLVNRVAKWTAFAAGVIVLGRMFRRDNPLFVWLRDPAKDSCTTCIDMDGVVMNASDWRDSPFRPKGRNLECGGWECGCDLYEVELEEETS